MDPSFEAEVARRVRAAVVTELPRGRPARVALLAVLVGAALIVLLLVA